MSVIDALLVSFITRVDVEAIRLASAKMYSISKGSVTAIIWQWTAQGCNTPRKWIMLPLPRVHSMSLVLRTRDSIFLLLNNYQSFRSIFSVRVQRKNVIIPHMFAGNVGKSGGVVFRNCDSFSFWTRTCFNRGISAMHRNTERYFAGQVSRVLCSYCYGLFAV